MVLALPACTKRLVLRRFEPQDVEMFFGYRNDPAVARFQSWDGIARSAALHFVRGQGAGQAAARGEWFQIALALAHSNQQVGDVGVFAKPKKHAYAGCSAGADRRNTRADWHCCALMSQPVDCCAQL